MALSVEGLTKALLRVLGEDPEREGLQETPRRVAKFYAEFLHPQAFEFTTFSNDAKTSEMVVQVGIPFYSLCEHHMVPFFGTAAVGYIPGERIVGLSKLARLVQHTASNFQNQERITQQVCAILQEKLQPQGCAVVLRARHLCMEMRGVRVSGAETVTSAVEGSLKNGPTRAEFFALVNRG